MKKICAMVLAVVLLLGVSDALAAASSSSLLLSMSVNESYEWKVPDAKVDCLVGVWGLWGAVEGRKITLGSGKALEISCNSTYGIDFAKKLENEKFCMVHDDAVSTGAYRLEYKLSTDRSNEKDIAREGNYYTKTWVEQLGRGRLQERSETVYIIGKWTGTFSQPVYYLIDPAEKVKLGKYTDHVTFYAAVADAE